MCMSIHVNGVLHQPEEGAGSAGAAAAGTVWFTQRLAGLTHQEATLRIAKLIFFYVYLRQGFSV